MVHPHQRLIPLGYFDFLSPKLSSKWCWNILSGFVLRHSTLETYLTEQKCNLTMIEGLKRPCLFGLDHSRSPLSNSRSLELVNKAELCDRILNVWRNEKIFGHTKLKVAVVGRLMQVFFYPTNTCLANAVLTIFQKDFYLDLTWKGYFRWSLH